MSADDGAPRLLVDCDPGPDDVVALAVAAHAGTLVGVTTVGGNAPLPAVTRNALAVRQLFDLDAPVHAGAAGPLVGEPRHGTEVHGDDGVAGATLPTPERDADSTDALGFLVDTIRGEEGLWVVALGPLTNLALAFRAAPDLPGRLAGVSFMGGSADVGNRTPLAEFNVLADPEAAAVVLTSGVPLRMAGLDLTRQLVLDGGFVDEVRASGTPGATTVADLLAAHLGAVEAHRGVPSTGLHDPCAVLAVTDPTLVRATARHVAVELRGELTRGTTVVDRRGAGVGAAPNVAHGHTLDADAARAVVLDALRARTGGMAGPR